MPKILLKNLASNINMDFEMPDVGKLIIKEIGSENNKDYKKLKFFYRESYKKEHILENKNLFEWQFKYNNKKVTVVLHNDKIIAHHGHIPLIFTDGKNDYSAFVSANVIVDPNYRRKGIMTFLMNEIQKKYDIAVNLGASRMGVSLYDAMNYINMGYLKRMIAIINPKKCVGICKNHSRLEKTVNLSSEENKSIVSIKDFFEIKDEILSLWENFSSANEFFAIKKDADFLNWRYIEHPIFNYECFGLWRNGKLAALLVYRKEYIEEAKSSVIRITELIGNGDALKMIIEFALLNESIADIGWIDWSCPNEKIAKVLRLLGFISIEDSKPAEFPLLCQPVDYYKQQYLFMFWAKDKSLIKKLPAFENWYITKGDGDADRPN